MALPCSCKEPKIKESTNKNLIHVCQRCGRVVCKI